MNDHDLDQIESDIGMQTLTQLQMQRDLENRCAGGRFARYRQDKPKTEPKRGILWWVMLGLMVYWFILRRLF